MYTGTMIDDLIAAVERVETSSRLDAEQESKLAYCYAVAQNEMAALSSLNSDIAEVA
ncbi:MAG: hypothetical protein JO356_09025 [Acidobacteria bacterium]|nr:hypothetical protein [Acidobacteriota bacterium]